MPLPGHESRLGTYAVSRLGGEEIRSFLPPPLPPTPGADLIPFLSLLAQANQPLGRLDGVASIMPGVALFIYMCIRMEAVLSSQIEGTQSSLSDLLLFEDAEVPGVPLDDVQEVSNYVAAMEHGLRSCISACISRRIGSATTNSSTGFGHMVIGRRGSSSS
jgi:Fic family protein